MSLISHVDINDLLYQNIIFDYLESILGINTKK
jgi:hypothetical protein